MGLFFFFFPDYLLISHGILVFDRTQFGESGPEITPSNLESQVDSPVSLKESSFCLERQGSQNVRPRRVRAAKGDVGSGSQGDIWWSQCGYWSVQAKLSDKASLAAGGSSGAHVECFRDPRWGLGTLLLWGLRTQARVTWDRWSKRIFTLEKRMQRPPAQGGIRGPRSLKS